MRFVKLEGDAVFCYADGSAFRDGERFVELIEACYFEFSNRLVNMARATTCGCDACAAIGSLGLKFIAHYGSYVIEHEGDREDLAGPDVILVHRLLKNTISDGDGPRAYAFFTDACRSRLPEAFVLPTHSEAYESFVETTGGVHDLEPVLDAMRAQRREYISSAEADFETIVDLPVPPAVRMAILPSMQTRGHAGCASSSVRTQTASHGTLKVASDRERRRMGLRTRHVASRYIDWRPFDYLTCRTAAPALGRFIGPRPETRQLSSHRTADRNTDRHRTQQADYRSRFPCSRTEPNARST